MDIKAWIADILLEYDMHVPLCAHLLGFADAHLRILSTSTNNHLDFCHIYYILWPV